MNGGLALRLTAPDAEKKVPHLANDPLLVRLGVGSLPLRELDSLFAGRLPETYSAVHDLWKARVVELLNRADDPDVAVSATGTADTLDLARADTGGTWRLSRFAYAHRDDGTLRLESPRATKMVTLLTARAAGLLVDLLRPCALHELQRRLDWLPDGDAIDDLVFLLRLGAVIEPCDGDGNLAEDVRPELMQWEFHDLLFHNRSRQGRHDAPLGAQFRFHDKLSPQPVVKPNRWASRALPLYRPTAMSIAAADPPFSVVLESRRSIRAHSDVRPITLDQVGDFLFRAARNRFRYMTSLGEFVSRPYPCGGASYEAEVYLTANRCLGLERGFYYYDPEAHTLSLVETANAD
ncbi:MAG: hypothetical protein QOE68_982, partial [Thermoanaerobaculia bacterium]|nr:hypothetical protein [Thermoanaerobaculia bacterium]